MALSAKRPSRSTATKERLLKDVTGEGGKRKRLNTDIEEGLYRRIKVKAVEEGRSISEITRELWIEYLSN